jgi:hypothetical protein
VQTAVRIDHLTDLFRTQWISKFLKLIGTGLSFKLADFCSFNRSVAIITFQVASGKPDKSLPASNIRTFTLY